MTVTKTENGWAVVQGGEIMVDGLTNAEAWRWIERRLNDDWSHTACRHDWSFRQSARHA